MTTSETAAKKDIQKLQRAIVDGLEDVKAQNIVVFNTEHLSPLFERVIVASGSSNRQTKALSASVRDAVREAGFAKPRIEGEDNGEWIIVDCGAAVAHIMQPTIREYYRLEDIWGDKPVRLKHGADKPSAAAGATTRKRSSQSASAGVEAQPAKPARKTASKNPTKTAGQAAPARAARKSASAAAPKLAAPAAKKSVASKTAASAAKLPAKKAAPRKSAAATRGPAVAAPAAPKPALKAPARKTASRKPV
jgi:ribosome-associated protein